MDCRTDAEIVSRVLKGDVQAYAQLVETYKGPIFNLALRMTGSPDEADDLSQEIFIRAYQKLYRFNQEKKFFSWLYTIGINVIRNHLKKKRSDAIRHHDCRTRQDSMTGKSQNTEEEMLAEENARSLEKAMQKLPTDIREAVILKYSQDLTFEEIAEITGDSVGAVKMRIYRGLEKIKRSLADCESEP